MIYMSLSFTDVQSTEMFRTSGGVHLVVRILNDGIQDLDILNSGFAVVTAAATGNELVKEVLMELKIDELILQVLTGQSKDGIQALYDAIRILLTPDDNRVVASQVKNSFNLFMLLHLELGPYVKTFYQTLHVFQLFIINLIQVHVSCCNFEICKISGLWLCTKICKNWNCRSSYGFTPRRA